MKVTVDEHTKGRPEKYPKLMKSRASGNVVLFYDINVGTVVTRKSGASLGFYSNSWDIYYFTDLRSTVTLEND